MHITQSFSIQQKGKVRQKLTFTSQVKKKLVETASVL